LHNVVLIFSGFEPGAIEKRWADQIGASIATSCETATHVVTSEFKRSVKNMTAISELTMKSIISMHYILIIYLLTLIDFGVKYIVIPEWLEDSAKINKPIDLEDPKASKKYIVSNPKKEAEWKFSLRKTLSLHRGPGGIQVFSNVVVFVTDGMLTPFLSKHFTYALLLYCYSVTCRSLWNENLSPES